MLFCNFSPYPGGKKEKFQNQIHSYLASSRETQENCALSNMICAKFSKY